MEPEEDNNFHKTTTEKHDFSDFDLKKVAQPPHFLLPFTVRYTTPRESFGWSGKIFSVNFTKQKNEESIENMESRLDTHFFEYSKPFENVDDKVYIAGSYFGSGIGAGTLFGEQIALMATNQQSDEIRIIEERKKPNKLPIKPILDFGVYIRLLYERILARTEI